MKRPRRRKAPTRARCVLLLVDVINDLEFPGGERLLPPAKKMARRVEALLEAARARGIPVVYANDNFGHWRSDFRAQVRHCTTEPVRGREIALGLAPTDTDYFVLKPKHSAFFATALEVLLRELGAEVIVLAGLAGDNCVLFTAHDAYMRDYQIVVPRDGVASESAKRNTWALEHMRRFLKIETPLAKDVDWRKLARGKQKSRSQRGILPD